jgi:hypothetical protein
MMPGARLARVVMAIVAVLVVLGLILSSISSPV